MIKYTIGWESDGKEAPILWEKYDYQFPRFSPYDGFCCIFPSYGKLMGKLMHFPYDEIRQFFPVMNAEEEEFRPRRNAIEFARAKMNNLANDEREGSFNE